MRTWNSFNDWAVRSELHSRTWVARLVRYLVETGLADRETTVLDYGCGAFDLAGGLASHVKRIDGFEPHPASVTHSAARASSLANANIYSDLSSIPRHSYDLVVVNSVIQYMESAAELPAFFDRCGDLLSRNGKRSLLVADIIPVGYSPNRDALAALGVALRHGFFIEMLRHLAKSALNGNGTRLARYDRTTFAALATAHGFRPHFLPENLTPSRSRYTCLLTQIPVNSK